MANIGELRDMLRTIVKELFPELNGYAAAVKGRVVKVHEQGGKVDAMHKVYSADVQPLKPDGSVDGGSPVIPDVEIPVMWAGSQRGIFCLPEIGAVVRLAYYYNDPGLPYIDAILGEGYQVPEHPLGSLLIQHSNGVRIEISKEGKISLLTSDNVAVNAGQNINATAAGSITLKASKITLDCDDIGFTGGGSHPTAFADVIQAVFDGHTHPGVHGETGSPTQKMVGHASSKVRTG